MHKFGIRLPNTINQDIELENKKGNTLWWDNLMKEIKNMRPVFEVFEGDIKKIVGYQQVKYHIIWDVKLAENFRNKD